MRTRHMVQRYAIIISVNTAYSFVYIILYVRDQSKNNFDIVQYEFKCLYKI